ILLEIAKEIARSSTVHDLYDVLIFTTMGQLGSASATVIEPSPEYSDRWVLAEHHGSRLRNRNITFRNNGSILQSIREKRNPVDLKEYENVAGSIDEYHKFFSIGARIAVLVSSGESAEFILLLGNRIEGGEYMEDELAFVKIVADMTGVIFSRIRTIDSLQSELSELKILEERLDRIDRYEFDVRSSDSSEIDSIIQNEMKSLQVNSYAYFLYNEVTGRYDVRYTEKTDRLKLKKNGFSIGSSNALISFCQKQNDYVEVEDPVGSDILKKVFPRDFLIRINVFGLLPYTIQGHLMGVLLILRIDTEKFIDNVPQIKRFSRFVFSQLITRRHLIYSNNHVDMLEPLISRVKKEYDGCRSLGIPLSVAVLTVSGYVERAGRMPVSRLPVLLKRIENIIRHYLSETDFSFRLSMQEITCVFPGKERKQVLKTAASIKNGLEQLSEEFSVTYRVREYPEESTPVDFLLGNIL
ncbi:MAG: hypothetical protein ACOCWH_07240, partial [Spirochaetota bacterium]